MRDVPGKVGPSPPFSGQCDKSEEGGDNGEERGCKPDEGDGVAHDRWGGRGRELGGGKQIAKWKNGEDAVVLIMRHREKRRNETWTLRQDRGPWLPPVDHGDQHI